MLTQAEADRLMEMEKIRVDTAPHHFPFPGRSLRIPLSSRDRQENFMLDITHSGIVLNKATYQNRVRKSIVLVRLDLEGPPHRNPDGEEMPCPDIHIYREGYDVKWAYPVELTRFASIGDLYLTLDDFMAYCNIVDRPTIYRTLMQ